ncbi:hypothetical protein KY290_025745 [Solanum tuberosum]|uniref:Uncharacterized protein n=1 Tax=Solanum tuberosum TaxID=4113 RepID=A0ABQ7UUF9_SOLTU|nr:hypothetical protein KY289_024805 [Solanum tuberosum]KAH0676767.1 hypothetical protein KY285_024568 [Solanum tuberosum]KAH0755475.1 hypothetical protein KY290_025745 [Solanum tuberosum]
MIDTHISLISSDFAVKPLIASTLNIKQRRFVDLAQEVRRVENKVANGCVTRGNLPNSSGQILKKEGESQDYVQPGVTCQRSPSRRKGE